jgi:hypothetical protein
MFFVEKTLAVGHYTCQPREETEVSGCNVLCFQAFSNRMVGKYTKSILPAALVGML